MYVSFFFFFFRYTLKYQVEVFSVHNVKKNLYDQSSILISEL